MKRYWDLSEYQRACLTEEELQRLTTVECMENGVVLPEEPQLVEVAEIEVPSQLAFEVKDSLSYSAHCYFDTQEKVDAFIALGPLKVTTVSDGVKYLEPMRIESTRKQFADRGAAQAMAVALSIQNEDNARNAAEQKRYSKELAAYHECTKALREDWKQCIRDKDRYEAMHRLFKEYVELCDGDRDKALAFLRKAKGEDVDRALKWHPKWQSEGFLDAIGVPAENGAAVGFRMEPADIEDDRPF